MSTEFEPRQPADEVSAHRRRLPARTKVLVAILLAIPMIALALVPTYSAETPVLWGFPFFYWYQLLWVILTPLLTWAAYVAIVRARRQR
jgi:cation transport ATPase